MGEIVVYPKTGTHIMRKACAELRDDLITNNGIELVDNDEFLEGLIDKFLGGWELYISNGFNKSYVMDFVRKELKKT